MALHLKLKETGRIGIVYYLQFHNGVETVYISSAQITFVHTKIIGSINSALTITHSNITFSGLTRIAESDSSRSRHVVSVLTSNVTFRGSTALAGNSPWWRDNDTELSDYF